MRYDCRLIYDAEGTMIKNILTGVLLTLMMAGCGIINTPSETSIPTIQIITNTITPSPLPTKTSTPTLTPTVVITPTQTAILTLAAYGPTNFPKNVDPLTGLIVSDPKLLERRPVAVKINIAPRTT